jgi:hypothetical protein
MGWCARHPVADRPATQMHGNLAHFLPIPCATQQLLFDSQQHSVM